MKIKGKKLLHQKRGEHLFPLVAPQAKQQFGISLAKADISKVCQLNSFSLSPIGRGTENSS